MSNRKSAFQAKSPNPCSFWLQWESDHKCLSFFDKEKEQKEMVKLPFKFLALNSLITVSGYNKARECGIYSNEVKDLDGIITAKFFDNNSVVASGNWNSIKKDVVANGGHFTHSIYIMTQGGKFANIKFKGTALSSWIEFTKKSKNRLTDEWVTITGAKEGGTERNKYSFPEFEFSGSLDSASAAIADDYFDTLENYLKEYFNAPPESNEAMEGKSADHMNDHEMDILINGEKEVNVEDADVSFEDLQKEPPF